MRVRGGWDGMGWDGMEKSRGFFFFEAQMRWEIIGSLSQGLGNVGFAYCRVLMLA